MRNLKSPFSSCPHAHFVMNPYTHEEVMVPCGKCVFCRMAKGSILSSRLDLESSFHPYTLFFTLTYDNEHLPRAYRLDYLINNLIAEHRIEDVDLLTRIHHEVFAGRPASTLYAAYLSDHTWHILDSNSYEGEDIIPPSPIHEEEQNFFGVLDKKSASNFIKRLRRYISYDKENLLSNVSPKERRFRYYICGEYGPNTLRPHYHGLLFVDSKEVCDALFTYIYKAWTLCDKERIDIQHVERTAASYVSSYVTSYINMPRLLFDSAVRPFYLSSHAPAIGVCQDEVQRVFEQISRGVVREYKTNNNAERGIVDYSCKLPRQVTSYLFPRCKNYRFLSKSRDALLSLYFPVFPGDELPTRYDDIIYNSSFYRDPERMTRDGSTFFHEVNITCYRRAHIVCNMFHLTPEEYIDMLVSFHDKNTLDSYSQYYANLEKFLEITPRETLRQILHGVDSYAFDSFLDLIPREFSVTDIEFNSSCMPSINEYIKRDCLACDFDDFLLQYYMKYSDNIYIYPFDSIPSYFIDLFFVDESFLLRYYILDECGRFHFNSKSFFEAYDIESKSVIQSTRKPVLHSYERVKRMKKINNSPYSKVLSQKSKKQMLW